MKVTVIKHQMRYTEDIEWPGHIESFDALLSYHGYAALLYDSDDFQRHPLISDITVHKSERQEDAARPAFWVTLTLGGDPHDVMCWTVVDLFELFDLFRLLPNV